MEHGTIVRYAYMYAWRDLNVSSTRDGTERSKVGRYWKGEGIILTTVNGRRNLKYQMDNPQQIWRSAKVGLISNWNMATKLNTQDSIYFKHQSIYRSKYHACQKLIDIFR